MWSGRKGPSREGARSCTTPWDSGRSCRDAEVGAALTSRLPHRCEVSPCYKPEKSGLRPQPQRTPDQPAQVVPDLCSLLCLPIMTFSGALP